MDWFLYDRDLLHERVDSILKMGCSLMTKISGFFMMLEEGSSTMTNIMFLSILEEVAFTMVKIF